MYSGVRIVFISTILLCCCRSQRDENAAISYYDVAAVDAWFSSDKKKADVLEKWGQPSIIRTRADIEYCIYLIEPKGGEVFRPPSGKMRGFVVMITNGVVERWERTRP